MKGQIDKMISDKALRRTKNVNRLPLVEVKWRDARTDGGWKALSAHRATHTIECLTVGRLTKADRREVQVAQSISEVGDLSDTMTIPRGEVIAVRRLRGGF